MRDMQIRMWKTCPWEGSVCAEKITLAEESYARCHGDYSQRLII